MKQGVSQLSISADEAQFRHQQTKQQKEPVTTKDLAFTEIMKEAYTAIRTAISKGEGYTYIYVSTIHTSGHIFDSNTMCYYASRELTRKGYTVYKVSNSRLLVVWDQRIKHNSPLQDPETFVQYLKESKPLYTPRRDPLRPMDKPPSDLEEFFRSHSSNYTEPPKPQAEVTRGKKTRSNDHAVKEAPTKTKSTTTPKPAANKATGKKVVKL